MTKIEAKIIDYTVDKRGNENVSYLVTFPRIILAEVNTHRMFSKNTSSSRAIPFSRMVDSVKTDPFIPIAWQKDHKGMQGTEYITDKVEIESCESTWLYSRDRAVESAKVLHGDLAIFGDTPNPYKPLDMGVTKQLCNRLLEPFQWVTMVLTSSRAGLNNFFELRCPQYEYYDMLTGNQQFFKSKKDWLQYYNNKPLPKAKHISKIPENSVEWLQINKGHAEIHISELAECMYDILNETKPRVLSPGEWHIPFHNEITTDAVNKYLDVKNIKWTQEAFDEVRYKVATSLCARTSYTVIGSDRSIDIERMVQLYDRLISQDPPHSSPLEHCGQAMTDLEYFSSVKGFIRTAQDEDGIYHMELPTIITEQGQHLWGTVWTGDNPENGDKYGWSRNLKGLKQLREIVEEY